MDTARSLFHVAADSKPEARWNKDGSYVSVDAECFSLDEFTKLFELGFRFGFCPANYRIVTSHPKFRRDEPDLLNEIEPMLVSFEGMVKNRLTYVLVSAGIQEAIVRRAKRIAAGANTQEQDDTVVWFEELAKPNIWVWFHDYTEKLLFIDIGMNEPPPPF